MKLQLPTGLEITLKKEVPVSSGYDNKFYIYGTDKAADDLYIVYTKENAEGMIKDATLISIHDIIITKAMKTLYSRNK